MRRIVMSTCLLAMLAGCAAGASVQRRYTGTLAGCDGTMTGTLTRIGNEFAFAPGNGSLLIRGTVAADGRLAGQLDTQPPGKPPYMLRVSGTAAEDAITVTYETPRCTARGRLSLRPVSLLP